MATYDQSGNLIPEERAVYETADPNIVKQKIRSGDPLPMYATTANINGQDWAFYPTDTALAMGKVFAAWDTVANIPAQIEQQLTEAAKAAKGALGGMTLPLLLGIGAFVLVEILSRKVRR